MSYASGRALPSRRGVRAEMLKPLFGNASARELEAIEPDQRRRMETLNGLHSNAEGLKLWLAGTAGAGSAHGPA